MNLKIKKKDLIGIGIIFLMTIVFLSPIFTNLGNWGIRDWSYFTIGREITRQSALSGQMPLWDAYQCGGRPFMANPQSPMFNPFTIITIIFGTAVGIKISILIYFWLGAFGMYCVAKHFNAGFFGRIFAASVYVFSSYFSLYLVEGHYWNMVWMLLPFIFYFFLKSLENPKYVFASAFFAIIMLFEGLSMGFVLTFLFLGIYALFKSIKMKKIKPLLLVAIIALIVVLAGAVKMLPQVMYISDNPRHTGPSDEIGYDFEVFENGLLNRDQGAYSHNFPGQKNLAWAEYGMYVGWIVILLFAAGLIIYRVKYWPLIATLLIFVILAFGINAPIKLWNMLLSLPLFSSMRQAVRVKAYILFIISIFSGLVVSRIEHLNEVKLGKKRIEHAGKIIAVIVLAVVIFDLFAVSRVHLKEGFIIPPVPVQKSPEFFYMEAAQVPNPYTVDKVLPQQYESSAGLKPYTNFMSGIGTKNCYETIYAKRGGEARVIWNNTIMNYKENSNYLGEVYFESDVAAGRKFGNMTNKASIEKIDWQGFEIAVNQVNGDDTLILAQNYEKGWSVKGSVDNVVYNRGGLIGVKVSSATKKIVLSYKPRTYALGLWLSLLSTVLFVFLFFRWEKLKITKRIDRIFHNL